uniref:Cyclosome subunit 8 n=1 Tax=Sinocyclocheilus grahami TaxID=75366 RepID=A0A672R1C0_SINGR
MAAMRSSEFGDLVQIKKQLISIIAQCKERGLVHSVKCAGAHRGQSGGLKPLALSEELEDARDLDALCLAKSHFELKEYDRAAYFLRGCRSQKAYFLYMYSRYLSGEKKKDDETVDSLGPLEKGQVRNEALRELRVELSKKHSAGELDGFGLYLYGVVLRKLDLLKEAVEIFVAATHALPLHWGSWLELCNLITNIEMLKSLSLPECWVRDFFMAHMFTELQMIKEALQKYQSLMEAGFAKSTYIISQIAVAYHNIRGEGYLQKVHKPKSGNSSMLLLIRVFCCPLTGNYYSLRSQHEKAALYFQRALKLNPRCLGAWTLMGHEYMEMKNTSAAIQAYRHAIEVNKRDYRAWYGLGQTYEILKMPFYSLYYYRKAHHLRPNDSRMLVALGECYEKLSQQVEAKKCYWRAYSVGDVERMALLKLAKLHEQLNESDDAAQCYIIYIQDIFSCGEQLEHAEVSTALRYLGQYYFKNKLYDEASLCAQRCCDYNDAREEGKALLRQISAVREQGEPSSTDLSLPSVFNPLINTTTPVRRASPLDLSSGTP